MNTGWNLVQLGELTEPSSPITYGVIKPGEEGDVLFVRGGDISDSRILINQLRTITKEISEQYSRTLLKGGELLMCLVGQPGQVAIAPHNLAGANIARQVGLIRLQKNLNAEFIKYFLQSPDGQQKLGAQTGGSVQQVINLSDLRTIEIPLPSAAEQQRIVAILDEACEAISKARANAEQNRQNARALFESYLQSVFSQRGDGWVNKPLSELCDIKHGFAFKSEYFTNEGDYTLLTPGNFFETGGYRDRGDKQKFYSGDIPQGFLLEAGDLLVAMTEQAAGLLGSPIIVPSQGKFLHNQRLGLVSGKLGIPWLNEFFFHVFNTQAVRQAIHESASGAKVRHTSPTKIGAVTVAFPASIEEQKAIVATLDTLTIETQRLESLYQRKIAALDELKQSLLQQAFSGQL
ncbi:restriction endonuclease subunit S [Aeromonas jandaei]|uniref:restriction endonuclease subunit S n=1 Tax=Aeromonas jandaei TaxID=650 RepID=UPI003EC82EC6